MAMTNISKLNFELLPQAPNSAKLTPSDYFLFPKLKKCFGDSRIVNNFEVESTVDGSVFTINLVSKILNKAGESV